MATMGTGVDGVSRRGFLAAAVAALGLGSMAAVLERYRTKRVRYVVDHWEGKWGARSVPCPDGTRAIVWGYDEPTEPDAKIRALIPREYERMGWGRAVPYREELMPQRMPGMYGVPGPWIFSSVDGV